MRPQNKGIKMGYCCDKCGGYYEIQTGEFVNDFKDLSCNCGGKLKYVEHLKEEVSVKHRKKSILSIAGICCIRLILIIAVSGHSSQTQNIIMKLFFHLIILTPGKKTPVQIDSMMVLCF